jgi:sodium transport system ATP-binding protein
MIVVHQLAKRFGSVQALHDVSFSAGDGRVTGLLGLNGAGKSTTLRIISTVLQADGGSAVVDGYDCAGEPLIVRSRLGVLPHASGIYPHLTALENIRYYGQLHGLNRDALEQRIVEWSRRLEMDDILDRRTQGFSHGQKLKVALARTLIHSPKNVILDEPTSGLDVHATRALRDVIRGLKDSGCCVLFSSHVMQEVAALCDDIVIVAHGRVVADGTPDRILTTTGASNLEDAFVRATDGEAIT